MSLQKVMLAGSAIRIWLSLALLFSKYQFFAVTFCTLSRAYMSVKELKEALQLNSTHFLNIYFASSVREDLAGAATWPWDKDAVTHLGKWNEDQTW